MKRLLPMLLFALLLIATLLVVINSEAKRADDATSLARRPIGDKSIILAAHWAKHFADLPSMARDSDAVIQGAVLRAMPVRFFADQDIRSDRFIGGIVFTDYVVRVDKVLKGSLVQGQEIVVVQTGGSYNGRTMQLEDDPLFESGEQAILFLKDISGDKIHAPDSQKFIVNGTPQARFRITGGQISALLSDDPFVGKFNGVADGDFIQQVAAAVSSTAP